MYGNVLVFVFFFCTIYATRWWCKCYYNYTIKATAVLYILKNYVRFYCIRFSTLFTIIIFRLTLLWYTYGATSNGYLHDFLS